MKENYDYIIAGAGASGLSLLSYLLQEKKLLEKRILLIDKAQKNKNDRTFCFWQKEESPFEAVVKKTWKTLDFHTPEFSKALDFEPFKYKMIQGLDLYNFCFQLIEKHDNVTFVLDEILEFKEGKVVGKSATYTGEFVFNSARYTINQQPGTHHLLQHFKGWFLSSADPVFKESAPVFMDFRVDQVDGCSFMYIMPLSDHDALAEYTLFSASLLEQSEYDKLLDQYIRDTLGIGTYNTSHEEFGVIPMTNAQLPQMTSPNVINIGTAGGYSKPSTGYTFAFIQKYCRAIAQNLAQKKHPLNGMNRGRSKYYYYDSIFLRVLEEQKIPAWKVFQSLFKHLPEALVLNFLDENTSFLEDLRVMNSVPKGTFIQAALAELSPKFL